MATPFALKGELGTVRLQDISVDLRRVAAEKAAVAWGLTGTAYLELMIAAERPREHRPLVVDVAKIERVLAGRMIPGPFPELPPQDPWVRR